MSSSFNNCFINKKNIDINFFKYITLENIKLLYLNRNELYINEEVKNILKDKEIKDILFKEFEERLINSRKKEKKLLKVKIEVPYDKRKKQILIKNKIKLQISQDQENFDIIIKELKNLIKLNEKDVILIRNKRRNK